MATIERIGFGQVEPNHLSAQRTAQIYAQLPAAKDIEVLENGQFVKYDYANGECNFTGAGEWMMVFNEVKLYDDFWRESYKDFAMQAKNYTPGDDEITHNGDKNETVVLTSAFQFCKVFENHTIYASSSEIDIVFKKLSPLTISPFSFTLV